MYSKIILVDFHKLAYHHMKSNNNYVKGIEYDDKVKN